MDEPGPTSVSLIYILLFYIFLFPYFFKRNNFCKLSSKNLQVCALTTLAYTLSPQKYFYYKIEYLYKKFLFIGNRWDNIRIVSKNSLYILFN